MRLAVVVLLVGLSGSLSVLGGGESRASASARIDLDGYADLAVAEKVDRVFVSDGRDGVRVVDLDDPSLPVDLSVAVDLPLVQPTDLALSDDDSTLFVVQESSRQLAVVDTTTLVTSLIDLGERPDGSDRCATDVAVSAGLAWVVDRCRTGAGEVLAVDPTDGRVTATGMATRSVFASSRVPATLYGDAAVIDVTDAPEPAAVPRPGALRLPGVPVAVTGDGAHVLVPSGGLLLRLDARLGGHTGSYRAGDAVVGVADDGTLVSGGSVGAARWFFDDEPVSRVEDGRLHHSVALTFAGERLVAVSSYSGRQTLEVLARLPEPASSDPTRFVPGTSVLDETRGRILHVPGGSGRLDSGVGVLVTDLAGRSQTHLDLPYASDLVVGAAAGKAYVTQLTAATITEVDLDTLATRDLPVSPSACPSNPTVVGGLVYFLDVCDGGRLLDQPSRARLRSLDPATSRMVDVEVPGPGTPEHLTALPALPGILLVSTTVDFYSMDVSDGPSTARVVGHRHGNDNPVLVDPDGRSVRLGDAWYAMPDFLPQRRTSCYGLVVVAARDVEVCDDNSYLRRTFALHEAGVDRPYAYVSLPDRDRGVGAGVLVGARRVYSVTTFPLRVESFDPLAPTTAPLTGASYLSVEAPPEVVQDEPTPVRIRLDAPEPRGRVVLSLTGAGAASGTSTPLGEGRVDEHGVLDMAVTWPHDGWLVVDHVPEGRVDPAREFYRPVVLPPRPLAVRVAGARRAAGGVYLFRDRDAVRVRATHRGATGPACFRLTTQVRADRGWVRPRTSRCVRTAAAAIALPLRSRTPLGRTVRARAEWRTGPAARPAVSRWVPLRRIR